jgi:hypothetical protein
MSYFLASYLIDKYTENVLFFGVIFLTDTHIMTDTG